MELLSNKIRKLRFENDEMTQKALAEHVGISRQTMNAIENCRHAPTVSVAIRIADVFHVSVDQLFHLDYEGKPAGATADPSSGRIREPARAAPDRSPAPVKEPIDIEPRHEPSEQEAERQVTLADLRSLVGP